VRLLRIQRLLFVLLALSCLAPAAAEVRLRAPPEIGKLLLPYLPETAASREHLRELLAEILATEGYFSPRFTFSGSDEGLEVSVDPGPRSEVASVDLTIDGDVGAEEKKGLLARWKLPVGQAFRQADWDAAKEGLLRELLAVDHAAARLVDSEAEVDAEESRAALRVHYDAGPRYRFGAVRVEGLERYNADLISRYNKEIKPGAPYREAQVTALQSALQASPYFSSVVVSVDTSAASGDDGEGILTAPVVVRVSERPRQRVSFGVGVSSNTGARVEVNDDAVGVFNQPWRLSSGLRLEQKKQTAYADVFLPPDEKGRVNSVGALVEASDIENLKTERWALGAQSVTVRGKLEQRLGINWQSERSTPAGAEETTSRALVPSVTWTWRDVDDLFNPRRGVVLQGQVGVASEALLSDANFVYVHARYRQYFPLGPRDTFSLGAEVGTTFAKNRDGIPQNYLFRAGGSGSVRGYAYQSLGVKEGSAVVGGRYLYVLSGEATHWFNESWGGALFLDAGDAVDELAGTRPALGYGTGVRWRSPAGPIGVDFAYGERDKSFQVHFSLAIPF
jgi:translocation and assembly module TamA